MTPTTWLIILGVAALVNLFSIATTERTALRVFVGFVLLVVVVGIGVGLQIAVLA